MLELDLAALQNDLDLVISAQEEGWEAEYESLLEQIQDIEDELYFG